MHSRMRPKYKPTINGKEVDLDLLYQIVTSHGGWEKVNMRNEWDDLLEHFHLPRGINGGLVIKQIYLKYLENYEKVYFLGEDGHKNDDEDDYDDIRNRRRTASKMTSRSSAASSFTPSSSHAHTPGQGGQLQSVHPPLSDSTREQLGLPKRSMTDYDKLVLSLQAPLPNEQDMAISVCTLLCNETKHVLRLSKCPTLLTSLLAHTGVYNDCGMRELMEETYTKGRDMYLSKFWEEIYIEPDVKSLLCETYVQRIQNTLGLEEEPVFNNYGTIDSTDSEEEADPDPEDAAVGLGPPSLLDEECDPASNSNLDPNTTSPEETDVERSRPSSPPEVMGSAPLLFTEELKPSPSTITEAKTPDSPINEAHIKPTSPIEHPTPTEDQRPPSIRSLSPTEDLEQVCCKLCPCNKNEKDGEHFTLPPSLTRSHDSHDKESKRVHQIALMLRNLSFEEDNAEVMAHNRTMLRFLLLTANCQFGTLMQNSLDTISNVAKYFKLQDPSQDPISSILLSSMVSGLFSEDRLKVICSLDAIRNLTRTEQNEKILANLMDKKVCHRLCELLTLCDIMMLIYTLECIHAITGIGESVCNEIVRVKGSISSFIALVTVEAQSYGPKGCIQMRVVETYTGGVAGVPTSGSQSLTTGASTLSTCTSSLQAGAKTATPTTSTTNSIQAIGLRTVSGQTVVPPQPQTLQQQQQQTSSFANSPSPLCGTVAAISVSTPPSSSSSQQQQRQQPQQVRISPQVVVTSSSSCSPTSAPISISGSSGGAFQVLHPHSSPSPISPSLRSLSPGPSNPTTHIAQGYHGKPNCLPQGHQSSSTATNNHNESVSHHPQQNNVNNHVQQQGNSIHVSSANTTANAGAPPQVSSHSLTQQVFTPSISSENMTEEAWGTAWLKGGFEQLSGTSIEEGELYRMYCVARKKHPASLLSQTQLIQCVKLVYGASVGPVMKSFGSTSLSFIEGIRPKISFQQANSSSVPVCNSLPTVVCSDNAQQPVSVATNGVINDGAHVNNTAATVPRPTTPVTSAHGASSPLSPILKATLSRPPTPKSPTSPTKSKGSHSKDRKVKDISPKTNSSKKKSKRGVVLTPIAKQQPSGKIMTPSSSAIRSLLASKVAQRQQKKLQQETKNSKKTKGSPMKMNGEASLEKGEESSASSSMNSIDETESKTDPSSLTFQGVLCNGSGTGTLKEEEQMEIDGVFDDFANNVKVKGMLVDLLERKVGSHKDTTNGIVGREIRISDKGLELIQNQNSDETLISETLGTTGESQEPQKMTFYASPELGMGVKRTASTTSTENNTEESDAPPPSKKAAICVNGNDDSLSGSETTPTSHSNLQQHVPNSGGSVLQNALSAAQTTSSVIKTSGSMTINSNSSSVVLSEDGTTTTTVATNTTSSNQMVHVPVRIMNSPNSQQITFGGRQMVIQQGGQIVLSHGSSQSLQGQVIISKQSGSGDAPKAFILIPQNPSPGSPSTGQVHHMQPITMSGGQTIQLTTSPVDPIQMIMNQVADIKKGIPPNLVSHLPVELLDQDLPFLCEWTGCGYRFVKYQQVFMHAVEVHCPGPDSSEAIRCEWGANGCDPLMRKQFSIMTHLQDRHCSKHALDLACYRRKNKIEPPPPPQQPAHHPGYAPNAAFHAIKRHALQYMNPKDIAEENEGPVTKSIRLTAALILRNLVNFSPQGRRSIAAHESLLSTIAMSNAESSRTICQLLFDMSEATDY
ncbi:AT-rich interactive domain-containing protein 2 isoform X5 [Folsomia candida]|uniref:AT-rich interactive domain-containing protein 2 isoform X5 n=1 Tax=Folsomia candida TaxID=158441 RepID=UPI0016051850|nr:AT-rich interactive domain-containing protein 2 isoform X5 [Folsomia candida]